MPGHALAALASYPHLGCTGGPYKVATKWGVFDDVMCAGKESTFEFLENVLDEVIDLFPSELIHIGGDECPKTRWKECPLCQERIKSNGLKDEHELQSYFIGRIGKYLNSKDANGNERWYQFSTNAIFKNEEFIGATGLMTDISVRKEAEEKLRTSKERYRHIFETVQDAYFEVTPEGLILDISPSIYQISDEQYTREELVGKPILQYYYNTKEREVLIENLYREGKVIDYELTFINKNGSLVPVSVSSTLLSDNQGIPTKITGSIRNISQRKKMRSLYANYQEQ